MKPLTDRDIDQIQALLDALPAPLEPLDVSALDGYLCGVLLQPRAVAQARWLPRVIDVEARAAPITPALADLQAFIVRRHAELEQAISTRQWFDPWLFQLEDAAPVRDSALPWVAGFALALEAFPALLALRSEALTEPLALLYLHFEAEDLEDDEPALRAAIDGIEPPADLTEAAEDVVRAVLLLADVSLPLASPPKASPAKRAPPRRR